MINCPICSKTLVVNDSILKLCEINGFVCYMLQLSRMLYSTDKYVPSIESRCFTFNNNIYMLSTHFISSATWVYLFNEPTQKRQVHYIGDIKILTENDFKILIGF